VSVPTAAERLARLCADLRWGSLPALVRQRSRELVLDLLGVALRGSVEPSTAPGAALAGQASTGGGASVVGHGFATGSAWAALANGTAAHAIEMDDVTTESSLHPGAVVVPAALAVAEERGASGVRFLEAVVAGYEVVIRAGNALNAAAAYRRGFHPTGIAGVFGAAVAAGRLLGLDAAGLTHAMGIAGTMASGSLEYLSGGAWTKRLNAGWAAHAGIVAAGLARGGFTGPATVFEGPLGFLRAYSDAPAGARLLAGMGSDWQLLRVSIKPYACCRYSHGLIDCVLRLRREHGVLPQQVERIRLGVLSGGALLVAEPIERKRAPANVVEAQFSAPFAAALALTRGGAGPREYTPENVDDPTIRDLMARTECYRDPDLDAGYPRRWPAAVELALRDGRRLATRQEAATGEPENPVPQAELVAKFEQLAGSVLDRPQVTELARLVLGLDQQTDLKTIGRLLRGPDRAVAAGSPPGGSRGGPQ
jgi:2-methylcitrate dehydratase PrpD